MNPGFFMPYTVRVIRCKSNNKSYRFKDLQRIAFYILVNLTVSGKSLAAFLVSAENVYQVGIFHLFIEVPDEASAGQVWEDATSLRKRISCSLVVGL